MPKQKEFLKEMLQKIESIEKNIENNFYYLESEDLRYKPNPKTWDIIEVFEHLNLVNAYYVKALGRSWEKAPEGNTDDFKLSWLGQKMVKSMEPKNGKRSFKMKTFKTTDPLILQKQRGSKLIDHIVFKDFMDQLKQFKKLMEAHAEKDMQSSKIKSLIPILKLRSSDALAFIIAHMERHILQAENLLKRTV